MDATPAYLRKPIVTARMHEVYPSPVVPKLKFITILRDPVRRLFAYWDVFVQSGNGVNNFDVWSRAVLLKVRECQKNHGDHLWPPPDTQHCDEDTIEGVAAGLYHQQFQHWLHEFEPQRFFVTSLSAYEKDTITVLRDVVSFIGAPAGLIGSPHSLGTPENTDAVRVGGGIPHDASVALGRFYHEHNAMLLHLFNHQPKVHFSPGLKALGIQDWLGV